MTKFWEGIDRDRFTPEMIKRRLTDVNVESFVDHGQLPVDQLSGAGREIRRITGFERKPH